MRATRFFMLFAAVMMMFTICNKDKPQPNNSNNGNNNTEGYGVNSRINGEYYNDSSIFSSGTLTINRTETDFTYKVTGTLKTGQNLSFHIHVPASEWEIRYFM